MKTRRIPKEHVLDAAIPILLSSGYNYISERCNRFGTDIFETRVLLRRALCIRGEEAAELFYDSELFKRRGAAPGRIVHGLLGRGGVHGLDGDAHRRRKTMFMSLMGPEELNRFSEIAAGVWNRKISEWEAKPEVCLFSEAKEILCRAACEWVGIPLAEEEVSKRAEDLAAMVDSFGAVGPRYWRGKRARARTEKWIRGLIRQIRKGSFGSDDLPATVVALYRDSRGKLLSKHTATVELINLIRPTVAVAYLLTFAALALHRYPRYRDQFRAGDETQLENFVQEVRRFYPFAPAMAAISRKKFSWKGYSIPKGRLVILDLYGTNHDPRIWDHPGVFRPERFSSWDGSPYNFIPNGGGDFYENHRCAGEWISIELLKIATRFLSRNIEYDVPFQDLSFPLTRLPTFPRSGFIIKNVRAVSAPVSRAA